MMKFESGKTYWNGWSNRPVKFKESVVVGGSAYYIFDDEYIGSVYVSSANAKFIKAMKEA